MTSTTPLTKMPSTTHASMHSAPLRKKSGALRSSARSGYTMRRLRHAVSRPCDAIGAVLEPSAVVRVVRCGRCTDAAATHPVLRRADRRRVEPTAPGMRRLGPPAGCGGGSVGGKPGRCLRVRHRCLCAFPRGRCTGLGVAGFAIRSRRDRHRPRASPRSPNKPYRASLKPPDSPAATREGLCRTDLAWIGYVRKSGAKTDVV